MSNSGMYPPGEAMGRLQAIADRVAGAYGMTPSVTRLLGDAGLANVSFSQRCLTVLYLIPESPDAQERERLLASAVWMAERHHGTVDCFHQDGLLVFFDTPERCLPMAMNLQRSAPERRLRMGIHAGVWEVAHLPGRGEEADGACALFGDQTAVAARTAASAAIGSIVISSQAYALVQHEIRLYSHSCILTEEFEDSGFATASLTPAPARGGTDLSTFAGLGLS